MKKFTKLFLVLILGLAVVLPMQVRNVNAVFPMLKHYSFSAYQNVYGIDQYRVDELCPLPAEFEWYDNGIPKDVLNHRDDNPGGDKTISLEESRIVDTGYEIIDTGVKFRKFGAIMNDGRTVYFWAHANNKYELVYAW